MIGDQSATTSKGPRARRREERTLQAAALTNGPNELLDFILPLWAGVALGLGATEVGVLLAVETGISVIVRPIAGVLADTFERRYVASVGALLYAASTAGYALASSAAFAYPSAALGGVGGALLWIAVRAIVSERLAADSGVFPRLLAFQETGSWVAFVGGMVLIGRIDFDGVFWACTAACLLAAVLLLAAPRQQPRADSEGAAAAGLGVIGRRLRPMLAAVALTMTAEAAVGLLLLLHLQREFDLDVVQVAYVFLPGAIAMSVAAERLHAYVVRFGRTRMLTLASVASAAFAAGLAWAPNPYVIAGLWVLSGLAWALVIPIQQAVIAEASSDHAGRGMGVYESAGLLGAFAGSLAAGVLYDTVDWAAACLSAAVVILAGAVVLPWAVRRLGVADFPPPPPPPPAETETPAEPAAEPARPGESPASPDATPAKPADPVAQKPPRQLLRQLAEHAAVFTLAQLALLLAGLSWLHAVITGDSLDVLIRGTGRESGLSGFIEGAGKIWTFILLVDVLWTATKCVAAAARRP